MFKTQDLHVRETIRLVTPKALKAQLPITEASSTTVAQARERITRILKQQDPRLLVVVGPGSIHLGIRWSTRISLVYPYELSTLRKSP